MGRKTKDQISKEKHLRDLIIINGIAGSGKNTFVNYVCKCFKGHIIEHSTVDTVKEAAYFFGANEAIEKGEKERALWSEMKDAWTKYNDGPFQEICNIAHGLSKNIQPTIAFIHVRESTEIQKIKDKFPKRFLSILIQRDGLSIPDNTGDKGVAGFNYDLVIKNNGEKKELKEKAIEFCKVWLC